jgi:O-antigen/teichoic acid export membrane protein
MMRRMFALGGWMSVSNIIGPIMVYFDRFFIGIWLSLAAVSYYVSPYEVVTKVLLIAGAVVRVLFPAFSATIDADPQCAYLLYSRGMRTLFFLLFPATLAIIVFAEPGLRLWLGDEFARQGAPVAQWLALGCLANSFAQVAFALVQAGGHPDLTAKMHLVEVPVYLAALWFFINRWGIAGAAFVWALRMFSETFVLFHWAKKIVRAHAALPIALPMVLMMLCGIGVMLLDGYWPRLLSATLVGLGFIVLFWRKLIATDEKQLITAVAGRYFRSSGKRPC